MFLGHFAAAFVAKKAAPGLSLGILFAAAQLADLLWPVFVLAGLEQFAIVPGITAVTPLDFRHYPYSHSLVALAAWAMVLGIACAVVTRGGRRAFVVVALLVLSHWFLDVLVHRPDMPLELSEQTKLGLGLWNSLPATLLLESLPFAAAVALYARTTRTRDRIGTYALAGLVAFLAAIYAANVWGPPPPSVAAVTWSCMALWLLVAWAAWADRHRQPA